MESTGRTCSTTSTYYIVISKSNCLGIKPGWWMDDGLVKAANDGILCQYKSLESVEKSVESL